MPLFVFISGASVIERPIFTLFSETRKRQT